MIYSTSFRPVLLSTYGTFSHVANQIAISSSRSFKLSAGFSICPKMGSTASYSTSYTSVVTGTPNTESYKVYIKDKSTNLIVSTVHDIPLKPKDSPNNIYNMVVEVPRWSNAKLEVCVMLYKL